MGHPKAQVKAIKQIRLFMQLTHIQHLVSRRAPRLGLFACSLVCLCAPKAVEEIVFRNVLWALLKGHHIPGFQQSYKELIRGSLSAAKPPALSAVCKGWEANQPRDERTEPGTDVGPGDIIRLLPEQTDPSGRELGLGGSQWDPETLCPWNCTLSFFSFVFFFQNFIGV